jgi:hypothetical protein
LYGEIQMSRTTFSGPVASTNGFIPNKNPNLAVNATAALAADTFVASGYITSTSAGATTITLPTAATMSVQLGAVAGQEYSFIVNNTAGASNVTIALGTGGTLSDAATIAASAVAFGRLVVAAGATGMAKFTLMFSGGDGVSPASATAYTLTRTA